MDDRAADGLHALGRLHAEIPASGQICQREHAGQMPVLRDGQAAQLRAVLDSLQQLRDSLPADQLPVLDGALSAGNAAAKE